MEPAQKPSEEKSELPSNNFNKRKGSPGTPEYLYETIREMNAFSEKDMANPASIERIELVLEELYSLNGMALFTNLKSLTLINVNIKKIEFLNTMENLTELWLNENMISRIEGLQAMGQLKSLYLSFNQISKIEGLENLKNLETLWLCSNQIEKIENLQALEKLKNLSLAGNAIENIKGSLDNLNNLNELNISGNKISTFKEALHLNRLPNLQVLAFYDPHFGENPICNLCNYQTYILYNLRKIIKLDTLIISEEAKSFAEATFMKKKMYYNMRIKTIQRSFSTAKKCIKKAKLRKIDFLEKDRLYSFSKPTSLPEQSILQEKIYDDLKKKLAEVTLFSINRLLLELDTGGNIRLEEGKGNEKWFISCVDLIKSRFHPEEMQKMFDIKDIYVNRVVRIHNRFLRNKFEEKMENLVDSNNSNYKKSLEYLFYGVDPAMPSEMFHIVEEGFRTFSEAVELGMCGYPALVNSILASDCPRLQSLMKNSLKNKDNVTFLNASKFDQKLMVIPSGLIVICKVLMLKSAGDEKYPNFDLEKAPHEIYRAHPLTDNSKKGDVGSIYRTFGKEEKHKLWFIFDNNLVLPEYLVEFQYTTKYEQNNRMVTFGSDTICEITAKDQEFITPSNINIYNEKINEIFDNLSSQISETNENDTYEHINDKAHHVEIKAIDLDRADLSTMKTMIINYFKFSLSELNKFQKQGSLVQAEQNKSKEEISLLDMKSLHVSILPGFMSLLENLRYLNLSMNSVENIEVLENFCPNLVHLNLSHNLVRRIKLKSNCLEYLDVSFNNLTKLEDLFGVKNYESLIFLKSKGNPFEIASTFYELLKQITPIYKKLQIFNHKILKSLLNNLNVLEDEIVINHEKIYENAKFFQDILIDKSDPHWKKSVESLSLPHQKIRSMLFGLADLSNLRKLNLSHNRIDKIEGLNNCLYLEELNLEKNNISTIEGISHLAQLKKLELGMNKISKLEGISQLENLMQLSLEENKISTLIDFPDLKNLMELYLANNLIANPKEIQNLKHLHKLIILDISGNPLSKDPNYRIFTLYNLKKLKVLDGVSVEVAEHQIAKDLFTGRLTEEILLSRLNGLSPESVQELDLTNCKLKDFEDIFNENYFPNLVELNLSVNLFTTTKMLGVLPKLKILILNSNKLETLFIAPPDNNDLVIGLRGCQGIEILDISNNNLKDLNGLQYAELKQLKILKADHNEISKLDSLDGLEQLKELDLNNNKIRQFEINSFSISNPIKCLKIEENGLKNFTNIQKLYKLQHLFASNNRLNELQDIEKLSELPNLKELELNGNAISKKPGYRTAILKKLSILLYLDGKEITNEEREKIEVGISGPGYDKTMVPTFFVQNPNSKVPVKLSAVNFDGVFGNVRFPSDNIPQSNLTLQKK